MTTEEKAKAYDEAIERAKKLYEQGTITESLSYVFPELKESEDERIRKYLIILLQHFCKGYRVPGLDFPVSYMDMLAWLEKQSEQILANSAKTCKDEQNPTDKEMKEALRTEYEKGRADAIAEIQKPAWSEEDEEELDIAISTLKEAGQHDSAKWLKSLKSRVQPKQEWSEEDERMFEQILQQFMTANNDCKLHNASFTYDKEISFLKSLEDRVQPKQEWNEEDEHRLKDTIYFLDTAKKHYASTVELDACINWLKSLRPQPKKEWSEEDEKTWKELIEEVKDQIDSIPAPDCRYKEDEKVLKQLNKWLTWLNSLKDKHTWKPSDEQMKALNDLNLTGNISYAGQGQVLIELYNDLKRLLKI